MKKFSLLIIFLIFLLLAMGTVASEEVENNKTQIDLIIDAVNLDGILELNINFPADAQGTVNFTVDGNDIEVDVVDGKAKVNVTDLAPGDYVIKASYSGDDQYDEAKNQTTVTIEDPRNATDDNSSDENNTPVSDNNNTPQNSTPSENKTPDQNTTPSENKTPAQNTTLLQNDTTVILYVNHTENNTPSADNATVDNVTTTVDNSTHPPEKEPEKPPLTLDAKTGLPILLVIIAVAILIIVRKYKF